MIINMEGKAVLIPNSSFLLIKVPKPPKNSPFYPFLTFPAPSGELSRLVGELSDRVGELSGLVGELSGLVGELSGLVGELSGPIGELSGPVGELSGPVGELSRPVGELSVMARFQKTLHFTAQSRITGGLYGKRLHSPQRGAVQLAYETPDRLCG
jgi:hypothetical protein